MLPLQPPLQHAAGCSVGAFKAQSIPARTLPALLLAAAEEEVLCRGGPAPQQMAFGSVQCAMAAPQPLRAMKCAAPRSMLPPPMAIMACAAAPPAGAGIGFKTGGWAGWVCGCLGGLGGYPVQGCVGGRRGGWGRLSAGRQLGGRHTRAIKQPCTPYGSAAALLSCSMQLWHAPAMLAALQLGEQP